MPPEVPVRLHAVRIRALGLAGVASAALLIAAVGAVAASSVPIAPRSLVLPRSALPGFANAKVKLESTASAVDWTTRILEDEPMNAAQEQTRLGEEGYREGVREILVSHGNEGFTAALLLGSHAAAQRETLYKASEEQAELGPGATHAAARAIPGGLLVEQPHLADSVFPGHYLVSVVFSEGDCTAAAGAGLRDLAAARHTAITGAIALEHKLKHPCG